MTEQVAQTQTEQNPEEQVSKENPIITFVPLVLIFVVFYFFIIRPQQKKLKEEQKLRANLKIGDSVILSSGFFATVKEINDEKNAVSVELTKGVVVTCYKSSIVDVLKKKEDSK